MIRLKVLSSLFVVLSIIKTCNAAEWDNEVGVGFIVDYVDNIRLAPSGEEESQYVGQLTPYVSIHGEGKRVRFDFDYQMQYLKYQSSDIDNEIYHRLYADANAEFIEQFFFLDLSAANFQSAITDAASIPQDNIAITDNRTNVTTTTISPYINTRILSRAALLIRYSLENTKYDEIEVIQPDTENKTYLAELSTSKFEAPLDWRLRYSRKELNTNLVETNYYEESSFTLFYNVSAQFIPYTTIGTETNKIVNTSFDEGGNYWNVGIEWRPTPRTTITGEHGERFYGTANAFSWTTRGKRTNIDINYTEEVTNAGQVFASRPPPSDVPPDTDNEFTPISIRPYLRKRLESNIKYNHSRTSLNWSVFNEKRIFLTGDGEDKSYGTSIIWDWTLTDKTSPSLSAGWQRIQSDLPTLLDNKLLNIDLGIVHISSKRLISSISYRYLKQHSNNQQNNYEQNSISLNVALLFDNN